MIVTIYEEVVLTKSYNYFHSDTIGFAQRTLTVTTTIYFYKCFRGVQFVQTAR